MKMKNCELCKELARVHCESDRANLCWSCDYKVHSANFLVARHSRNLLCRVCQSPTPWTASGLNLGPTVSVCDICVQNCNKLNADEEIQVTNEDEDVQTDMESDNFDDDDEDEEYYDEEEDTDCEDNQVVPWSPSTPPPPSAANSPSNSDEESFSSSSTSISSQRDRREPQQKRTQESENCCYHVNSLENADIPAATVSAVQVADGSRPDEERVGSWVDSLSTVKEKNLNKRRRTESGGPGIPESSSRVVIESIRKLHEQEMRSSGAIVKLCKLTEHPSAVHSDISESS